MLWIGSKELKNSMPWVRSAFGNVFILSHCYVLVEGEQCQSLIFSFTNSQAGTLSATALSVWLGSSFAIAVVKSFVASGAKQKEA